MLNTHLKPIFYLLFEMKQINHVVTSRFSKSQDFRTSLNVRTAIVSNQEWRIVCKHCGTAVLHFSNIDLNFLFHKLFSSTVEMLTSCVGLKNIKVCKVHLRVFEKETRHCEGTTVSAAGTPVAKYRKGCRLSIMAQSTWHCKCPVVLALLVVVTISGCKDWKLCCVFLQCWIIWLSLYQWECEVAWCHCTCRT